MKINEIFMPGDILTIGERTEEGSIHRRVRKTYRVAEQYPHHVVVENEFGTRHSITNAELFQNGLVTPRIPSQPKSKRRKSKHYG